MTDATVLSRTSNVLGINQQDRVHVLIDASYMMGMLRTLECKLDYKLFLAFLREETRLVRASYFVTLKETTDARSNSVTDMIEYAGFDVIRKWGHEVQEQSGFYRFKGSIVPEMTIIMMEAAETADHLVLVTGDGDFYAGMEASKNKGVRVTLLSHKESTSDDLRRAADSFVDFSTLPEKLFFV